MRWPDKASRQLLAVSLILAGLAIAAWSWFHWRHADSAVPMQSFDLQAARLDEWKAYGGSWNIADGAIHSNSYERGAKLLAGSKNWDNYTLNADMRFDGVAADMGVIIRSNDESRGVDSYNGYFIGLRSLDGTLMIGHSNYAWGEARPVLVPGGVHPSIWYRMRVTAYGCNIAVSAQNLTTNQTAWLAFQERSCVKSGRIGLRSLNANAMWRNISVTPAGWNDYQALRQHVDSVEQLVILDGPPWWTPWHVGMLFAAALALALLTQLIYFRVQQWKAFTITRERERLAHEIHDTMAQSFAGVGYQIQGIRRSVVRDDLQDTRHIADQLSVAYQLVRRCHEEASRTIAMLSSSSPLAQENLLGALANTARKIAGDQIKTNTELIGSSTPLNLRLADALLHIGQEAIANAVGHSDPTVLTITLTFEKDDVELTLRDNGQGFDYCPATAGFGILGMQKRARDILGTFNIMSMPGQGTVVSVRARLQEANRRLRLVAMVKEWFVKTPPGFSPR
ncbi:family 16 glycoside hydrolase [Acidicapsa ligni]|uniref:family 16 glycoside hydrolase n=1 Tax=Acidicapsa ligni TaxID=542300 RepID=UPI0021E06937|nr:family 16 glycoside hydrolase [Acidicapsa ligni]